MRTKQYFVVVCILLWCLMTTAQNPGESRMMTDPSVSSSHIVFVYANDLWVAVKK
jgi:hypothetical protein